MYKELPLFNVQELGENYFESFIHETSCSFSIFFKDFCNLVSPDKKQCNIYTKLRSNEPKLSKSSYKKINVELPR